MPKEPMQAPVAADASRENRIRERARQKLDERGDAYSNHEEILIEAAREIDNEDAESSEQT